MSNEKFGFMRWDHSFYEKHNLPECGYPIPIEAFKKLIDDGGTFPLEYLLVWLQLYTASVEPTDELERAMRALIAKFTPDEPRPEVPVLGDTWRLISGPVDLTGEIVTVQRREQLVAAVERVPGGLRASCYRPLDAKAIRYLLRMASKPAPDGTVCMRPDNFEYAKDTATGTGNRDAYGRGESHLSYWEFGLGVSATGERVTAWCEQRGAIPLPPAALAVQLGIHWQLQGPENDA